MSVITITREFASGGRRLGLVLSKRLGYQYVDKAIFQQIAENLSVSEKTLQSFEQSREYRISNIFSKLFSTHYIQRIVGRDRSVVEEHDYQTSLKNLILNTAAHDNVIIIGRAGYYFLKDMENCFNFHLVASMDFRKKYAVKHLSKPEDRVEESLKKSDRNHKWFLKSICGDDFYNPQRFHLTMNMDCIPFEKSIELITSAISS